jgi:hypothetical protein
MSESFTLPYLPVWALRLIASPVVELRVRSNPMLFALWYALIGRLLDWPEEAKVLQQKERTKKLSFERASSLLQKVNFSAGAQLDLDYARALLEGYSLHEWVVQHTEEFKALINGCIPLFERYARESGRLLTEQAATTRLDQIASALDLAPAESSVLHLAFSCTVFAELRALLTQVIKIIPRDLGQIWEAMFDHPSAALMQALSSKGVLRKIGLIKVIEGSLPSLSHAWIRVLTSPHQPLLDALVQPLGLKAGAGMPARMDPADLTLAAQILRNSNEPGVNLLLYGAEGLEKRALLLDVLDEAHLPGFALEDNDYDMRDWPSVAYISCRLLCQAKGPHAVLVIERPTYVLERVPPEFIRMLLGVETDSGYIAPFDELMLESNPCPVVWAGPGADALPEECVARFVFHAPLKKARRSERRAQLERHLAELPLSVATRDLLLTLEDLSALQLHTAQRAAALSGAKTSSTKEEALVQAVKRSLGALNRQTGPKSKECVTQYSLDLVNYSGRFGPKQILQALRSRPKGTLCLYGPPGTGKTQFVEYLAQELGQRLLVKSASDLLSKWVGDNEKNIALMFQEAEQQEAILFLDEGDSFLRDRSLASHSWEVTQVNELLQRMERFPGIFIVATNLFRGLDAAALRRFTFKLEFCALTAAQRWQMFLTEAALVENTLDEATATLWEEQLCLMPQLTPGDFATVKRQALLLGEHLSPEAWLEQLQLECNVKAGM